MQKIVHIIFLAALVVSGLNVASASCVTEPSVVIDTNKYQQEWCNTLNYNLGVVADVALPWLETEEKNNYWSSWWMNEDQAPIISQSIDDSYLGLGLWVPDEFKEMESEMTTAEWLMNQGVQLSLGLGDPNQGEARWRLDYRWHQETLKDIQLQVAWPF